MMNSVMTQTVQFPDSDFELISMLKPSFHRKYTKQLRPLLVLRLFLKSMETTIDNTVVGANVMSEGITLPTLI